MEGPHDLGGKGDFGPIDTASPEFRADWEARQWALTKTMDGPHVPIDWFRHALEAMPPAVYLSVPYFQKWNANALALFIDTGVFTLDEVVQATTAPGPAAAPLTTDALEDKQRRLNRNFCVPADTPAAFQPGDRVETLARPSAGHTRLPAYARAATGTVVAHHGAHLYADAGARGEELGHHLYTVEFRAAALWPDAEDPEDSVCLDLWEPYLAPAH